MGTLNDLKWTDAVELASPHPYVLATTVAADGTPNIIGIGWFTIVSWSPAMACISVAPPRHSYANLEAVGEYVINFPAPEQARAAWTCGTRSGRDIDKFAACGLEAVPSAEVRPPTIGGSIMAWECVVTDKVDCGDHRLYIAEIVATRGDMARRGHLYSVHYRSLIAADPQAMTLTEVEDR